MHSFWLPGQPHMLEPLHCWPPSQSLLVQQSASGMHLLPQAFCPVGHAQVPAWHVSPVTTALHSAFWQQLPLGMQLVPHVFWPPGHTHAPA
jgi:hypothetical protein